MKFKFGPPKAAEQDHINQLLRNNEESGKKHTVNLLEIINRLWRIKSTAEHHGTDEQKEYSLILRNVSSALDIFEQMGFSIKDHTGEKAPADGTLSWKVISYQEESGIERETVTETLKPSVLIGGQLFQRGEVIISTPIRDKGELNLEEPEGDKGGQG